MAREKGREDGAEHSKESEPAAVFPPILLFICFRIFRDESQVIQLFFRFFFPSLLFLWLKMQPAHIDKPVNTAASIAIIPHAAIIAVIPSSCTFECPLYFHDLN